MAPWQVTTGGICGLVLTLGLARFAYTALLGALGYGATFIGIVSLTLALALALALVGRRAPGNPGKAMARLTLSYGAAQVVAPAVAGVMAQASGSYQGALWLTAAVMVAGMACLATLPDEAGSGPR